MKQTPGLWKHKRRPIQFSLIVDDFGVKYVGKEHADYLLSSLRKDYKKVTADWTGSLYAGITLDWNYNERWVDTSMPGYVGKLRQRFNHKTPNNQQHSPFKAAAKVFGAGAQDTVPGDNSPKLNDKQVNVVQQ